MSNDARIDVGSDYPFRIEASDTKRVRVLNLGPSSIFYDASEAVSADVGTELAVGSTTDFSSPLWMISVGASRAYIYHYDQDDFVDPFEARATGSAEFAFFPSDIAEGESLEWDGTAFIPASYTEIGDISAKQDASVIVANGLGVCVHGATAGTTRPTGYARIMWIGSVTPTNATDNDLWVDTS